MSHQKGRDKQTTTVSNQVRRRSNTPVPMLDISPILILVVIVMLIIASVTMPPRKSCGLIAGAKYRVKCTFESLNGQRFEEGEILIFKRERRHVPDEPCPGSEYVPEHDYWVFGVPGTKREKHISGYDEEKSRENARWANPDDWIGYFDKVSEPTEVQEEA